ncbi:hypothetical protein [Nocardioides marmoribigeumensis]|uniref:Uncharacterized protein n=1 Tax=Nocardioides marmoribigeumensis TaxID=433649 RepID=A0ABU2BYI8_9ACTN|nr:hypothetical protein [Nocardioides marmoribigeumensis]MDR7363465.1 hypothetical protein [Nocardioides marmoribigeumensis]
MTIQHTPAPARTASPTPTPPGEVPAFRRHGLTLTAGATAWAGAIAVLGFDGPELAQSVEHTGSGLFQVGLLALLRVLWRTRALGEGRLARAALRVETALVLLAMASTVGAATHLDDLDRLGWALLDVCWPLSMAGMFLLGIRTAVAGRWRGVSRWWPMVAESWAFVVIPTLALRGEEAGRAVAAAHLVVGYAVLGLVVARKRQ